MPLSNNKILIREATPDDAEVIARLVGELGYPTDSVEIPNRLKALNDSGTAVAYVAEVDSKVAGLATAHMWSGIHATHPVGWLTSLVVSSDSYRHGVGRALVDAAIEWVRSRGGERINLTSALRRKEAHEFYKHIGFSHTGVRLTKEL
jgi:phage shock protein PspC (stress-responsive transcriptional regulator)/GNAT superfamily N-acetyltransferase